MPIKVFKMHESDYTNGNSINEWADKGKYKITNINVVPVSWYTNKYSKVEDMELIITVIYHKKRQRREQK